MRHILILLHHRLRHQLDLLEALELALVAVINKMHLFLVDEALYALVDLLAARPEVKRQVVHGAHHHALSVRSLELFFVVLLASRKLLRHDLAEHLGCFRKLLNSRRRLSWLGLRLLTVLRIGEVVALGLVEHLIRGFLCGYGRLLSWIGRSILRCIIFIYSI